MPFTIAHSPDSDDAYMMAPLALGWLDPEGFDFRFVRKDIEALNLEALEGRYEVTAISFGAYPDGIAFAVLLMNICVPLIDMYTQPPVFGHKADGKQGGRP